MNKVIQTHRDEIGRIAGECRHMLLEQVAPFWSERAVDDVYHGYYTCFDRKGRRYDSRKPGWFLGRTMYTFSSLCQQFGAREEWLRVVQAGIDFLPRASLGDGRFAQMLSREGEVLAGATSIFTDHFAVKGLINYLAALGEASEPEQAERVRALLERLLVHVNNPEILAQECPDRRFQKHAVNFMTMTVLIEARKLFGTAFDSTLRENVFKSLYQFASDDLEAPLEYISQDGRALPEGPGRLVDSGHTMESLWFSMEAADLLKESAWYGRAGQVLDWVIDKCWDERFGGFMQHVDYALGQPEEPYLITDYDGVPVAWDDKIWWVQAEGLIALCMSALRNDNEGHWRKFIDLYAYVRKNFVEENSGEWFCFLKRNGDMLCDNLGSTLKGPYHVPRCLATLTRLLESAANAQPPL